MIRWAQSSSAIEELEDRLEGAEHILSRLDALGSRQAERVAQRMDRLASQLLKVCEPPPVDGVHQLRLDDHPLDSGGYFKAEAIARARATALA